MDSSKGDLEKIISNAINQTIIHSSTRVPFDVRNKLEWIQKYESSNPIISSQMELIIENLDYGCENEIPICQDTGLVNFFIKLGNEFPIISDFKNLIQEELKNLTADSKIRPNTVDPITQKNNGDNCGSNMPPIYLELIEDSSDLVITVLNKGGGSENISCLYMLSAATGLDDFIPKIVETIVNAGGKPCPPVVLGVGLGGDAVKSMFLAKKALLRPLGSRNSREDVKKMEEKILACINSKEIGVMGLGGNSNCLDVRIEYAMRHPASYPVGLIVQCYSHRTYSTLVKSNGETQYGSLDENFNFIEEDK